MNAVFPEKLEEGDEVRVVSPSTSGSIISRQNVEIAVKRLEGLGLKVSFGKNWREKDAFNSSSIESRLADLHEAFEDENVRGILTSIGGFNSNQLLPYLDYDLIRKNAKVFCGYSDITALNNAFLAKAGLVTYSGPHFSSFGMVKGFEYTLAHFHKAVFESEEFAVIPSKEWSDDAWYLDQDQRVFEKNDGLWVFQEGESGAVEGEIVGGNLSTFQLLHGTKFMPGLNGKILFLEECEDIPANAFEAFFDRMLQSVLHQPGFEGVRGVAIGRFQKSSNVKMERLLEMASSKKELEGLPIVANADFGHTSPMFTFPIGGTARVQAEEGKACIEVLAH